MESPTPNAAELLTKCQETFAELRDELGKVIVGQDSVIEQVIVAILARGHALLEGVPGLAKTLLIQSLADAMQLSFKRIQFTPDLMPSDVTGTDVLQEDPETRSRKYQFVPGPVFANLLLADEINRTPPKTQAAMLEAMQEHQVSAGGTTHALPEPFFVLATQNPLEQEGTYPLPEAQLDRFLLHIVMDYPAAEEEWELVKRFTGNTFGSIVAKLDRESLLDLQTLIPQVPIADHVLGYAYTLVRASRPEHPETPDFINEWVRYGAGPRGVLSLVMAAKARAAVRGNPHATVADVKAMAKPTLRHRIAGNYAARANDMNSDQIIDMLLEHFKDDQAYTPAFANES